METQEEPLLQLWVQLSVKNFWEFVIQVRDFLDENLEEIAFGCVTLVIMMLYCLEIALLTYYQRMYPQ